MARPASKGASPTRVFTARSLTEANLAVAFLEEEGIRAQVQDENFHGSLDGVALNVSAGGGIGVVVASDKAAAATKALKTFERHKRKGGKASEEE